MDQTIPVPNAQLPALAASSVYRLLLADEIAMALTSGSSVAATGTRDADDILDLTATALVETGTRVLQFRPPLDGASFISQFASQWRSTAKGPQDTLPQASNERFVMLFRQAHSMEPETLQHLERMAQAWPGMQMAFSGLPSLTDLLQSEGHPAVKRRVTVFTKVAVSEEPHEQPLDSIALPPATELPPPTPEEDYPSPATPTFIIPQDRIGPVTRPLEARPKPPRKTLRWVAAFAITIAAAALAAGAVNAPQLQKLAETAKTYLSAPRAQTANISPKPPDPPANPAPLAKTEPATSNDPAPPPLWTTRSPDPPDAAEHTAAQLTFIGKDQPAEPVPPDLTVASTPRSLEPAKTEPPHEPAPLVPSGTVPGISLDLADAMTRRGKAMLEWGDVSAARALLTRATSAGSGAAALAMGTTFDAATLDRIGAVGILPDPVQAAAWYRVALVLGEERAQAMLESLPTSVATARSKDAP